MTKQIKIEELIPFMKKEGYLYADRKSWFYTKYKPVLKKNIFGKYFWFINSYDVNLSDIFNITTAKDWTKSLIKLGGK